MPDTDTVPRPSPILELNVLSRSELSALTKKLRSAQLDIQAWVNSQVERGVMTLSGAQSYEALWADIHVMRLEVRALFLHRLNA